MKNLTEAQIAKLKEPLPDNAIAPHPTKPQLSTIKGIYITERLNDVFGIGAWSNESVLIGDIIREVRTVPSRQNKAAYDRVEYTAVIKTVFQIKEYGIYYECIAGSTNDDAGDATKGGITDTITKITSWLGIGNEVYKGEHPKQLAAIQKAQQQDTPPPPAPEKPVLNPDNKKEWDYRVLCLQNKKETLEQISKAFNITEADKALLLKSGSKAKPTLKPGSDNWNKAVEFLSKEGNKLEAITWKYSISDQDLSDLQTDVMNYQPTEANTTK